MQTQQEEQELSEILQNKCKETLMDKPWISSHSQLTSENLFCFIKLQLIKCISYLLHNHALFNYESEELTIWKDKLQRTSFILIWVIKPDSKASYRPGGQESPPDYGVYAQLLMGNTKDDNISNGTIYVYSDR